MSFNIPIFFDDSPFFEGGNFFRRQPRNEKRLAHRGRQARQPNVWTRPDFIFDDPREERLYRPIYRNRREQFVEQPRSYRTGKTQFEGSEEEDTDPKDYYSWDIPVQFVKAPVTRNRHHKHNHARQPQDCTGENETRDQSDEEVEACKERLERPVQRQNQRNTTKNKQANRIPSGQKIEKHEQDEIAEKVKTEEGGKEQERKKNDKAENLPSDNEKALDSNRESKENNDDTEISVQHATPVEDPSRRKSKRFSQCDPPPLSDIKLTRINSIVEKTKGLDEKISEFSDPVQNKKFLYISETLMKLLLDLDKVDSEGIDVVRKARKEGVQTVQNLVEQLENKLAENKKSAGQKDE